MTATTPRPLEGTAGQIYDWILLHKSVTPYHAAIASILVVNALAGCRFTWNSTAINCILGLRDGEHTKGSSAACLATVVRLLDRFEIKHSVGLPNVHGSFLVSDRRSKHHYAPDGMTFTSDEPPFRDDRPACEHPIPASLLALCEMIRQAPGCAVEADYESAQLLATFRDATRGDLGTSMAFSSAAIYSCLLAINRNPLHPVVKRRDTFTALWVLPRIGNRESLQALSGRLNDLVPVLH